MSNKTLWIKHLEFYDEHMVLPFEPAHMGGHVQYVPASELEKAEARIVEIEAQSDTLARCLAWLQNNVDSAYTVENIEKAMGVKNDQHIPTQEWEG